MRIVSLLPSTTEIVFDLGLADQLRGVTVECNWPQHAKDGREIVVDTFTNPTMTPGEIDAIVKERVAQGLDLYNLDDAALARCAPNLILSQDLCRVCAVASGDVNAAVARLNCDANVLQIDPQTLHQVIDSINTIAEAAGVASRGTALTHSLHARLEKVADNVRGLARPKCSFSNGSTHHLVRVTGCPTLLVQQAVNLLCAGRESDRCKPLGKKLLTPNPTWSLLLHAVLVWMAQASRLHPSSINCPTRFRYGPLMQTPSWFALGLDSLTASRQ